MGPKTTVENAKTPADWVTLKGVKDKDAPVKDEDAPVSIAERRRRRRTGGN